MEGHNMSVQPAIRKNILTQMQACWRPDREFPSQTWRNKLALFGSRQIYAVLYDIPACAVWDRQMLQRSVKGSVKMVREEQAVGC